MELIKSIINNQWIINIGTGLVVYIVTTIISRVILNKATNNEKQKQIQKANKEIIRILKPYVVEKNILTEAIISSVRKSVAREYNVISEEVFSVKDICEELIREILQSSYVDSQKKSEYIYYLNDIIENLKKEKNLEKSLELVLEYNRLQIHNENKFLKRLSICMMIIVLIISIIITIFEKNRNASLFYLSEPAQITILIILTEITLMFPMLYDRILKYRENAKKKTKKNTVEVDKSNKKNKLFWKY